jgi:hypothetical protein
MPSCIVGNRSGGDIVISGGIYSGHLVPVGSIFFWNSASSSGNLYIGFSGGITVASGGFVLSGGGALDGMEVAPGKGYSVPNLAVFNEGPNSGMINMYASCDAAASGRNRLYWELF